MNITDIIDEGQVNVNNTSELVKLMKTYLDGDQVRPGTVEHESIEDQLGYLPQSVRWSFWPTKRFRSKKM